MTRLELKGISVRRGERLVLEGVDARFRGGHLAAVIGPNGAGKSTLLDVAAGLLEPAAGRVELDGQNLRQLSRKALAKRRAYLPQSPRVDWPISVERVVALGLSTRLPAFGALPSSWQPRIDQALERQDLLALTDRPATRLSGGELSRAMLARATVGDPDVLIVDEPTAGLDPRHALEAARSLRALADSGCAVILAIHDLDLAARIADDVVAMKHGRVMAAGAATDIFADEVLSALYDVNARVSRDADGASVRFLD